jgi:hypothetical protein
MLTLTGNESGSTEYWFEVSADAKPMLGLPWLAQAATQPRNCVWRRLGPRDNHLIRGRKRHKITPVSDIGATSMSLGRHRCNIDVAVGASGLLLLSRFGGVERWP